MCFTKSEKEKKYVEIKGTKAGAAAKSDDVLRCKAGDGTKPEKAAGGKTGKTEELEETVRCKAGDSAKPEKAAEGKTGKTEGLEQDGGCSGTASFPRILLRRAVSDIKSIRWAILLIAVCFLTLWTITGSICPMAAFTGFPCPGCGLTRAGIRALTFDFPGAWQMNPFIFPIAALIFVWCIYRYALFRKPPVWFTRCAAAVLAGLVLFYIWRMIRYFPGEAPMNYYADNLLSRLSAL